MWCIVPKWKRSVRAQVSVQRLTEAYVPNPVKRLSGGDKTQNKCHIVVQIRRNDHCRFCCLVTKRRICFLHCFSIVPAGRDGRDGRKGLAGARGMPGPKGINNDLLRIRI